MTSILDDTAAARPPATETSDEAPPPSDARRLEELADAVDGYRLSRDSWTLLALGFAFLTAIAAIIAVGLAMRDDEGGSGAVSGQSINAELSEFTIDLSSTEVNTAGVLTIHNGGTMVHNVGIRGTDLLSADIAAGETAELDLSELGAGTYEVFCEIPGHADSGMTTSLSIGGGAPAGDATASHAGGAAASHAGHEMTAAEAASMDATMMESIAAFPAETEGRGNVPLEPELLPDGTKRFELTAGIVDWEVSPGQIVQAWAYNGMVPGPHLDLAVGDKVQVDITNDLPIGTDIHWHGLDVPNGQDGVAPLTQELIESGTSYTYEFTVTEPAVSMYHAHAHAQEAVPNGMFGTIFVGDMPLPAGKTVSGIKVPADVEVSQHLPMVLNDAGVIGLTLDGKSFPATTPITASVGDWIELSYYNEGLQIHPMHLHGFEQIVIAKDGEPLDHPYAADTIAVAPGERYTVLINATEPGTWVWHCHILNHVESADGMFGMVTALVVT